MKDGSDQDWKAAWKGLPKHPAGACPAPETVSSFVSGSLENARRDALLDHLASCAACREEVVAARAQNAPPAPIALRLRLYRLPAGRPSMLPRAAVAAAVLLAVIGAALAFWPREQEPAGTIVVRPAKPAPKDAPKPPDPKPEPLPEPPKPAPKPDVVPLPEIPKPLPAPEPRPEAPVVPKPVPAPEKPPAPVPAPEKPAPEPTRVALKGSVFSIAGSATAQAEGDANAQPLRAGQKRDFSGTLKLKAEVAAAKVSIGSVTYYLQRGAELSLLLEEGRSKISLAKGEAFFDVTPGQGQFIVEAAHGRVTVKGTRFLVTTDKTDTEVVLQKGAVEFAAAEQTVALSPGEQSAASGRAPSAPQKADLAKRLSWVRTLEESIVIEADQMALQGGMTVLPDPTALGGRAIGIKTPLKAGQEAIAEIPARRKQQVPYVVWVRLHWAHGVASAMTLSVGNALTWSSKGVAMNPNWQWVRVGAVDLDERFRVRISDTQPGMRIDQILITTDVELNPDGK